MPDVASLGQDVLGYVQEYVKWQYRNKDFDMEKFSQLSEKEQARIFRQIFKRVQKDKHLNQNPFVKPV